MKLLHGNYVFHSGLCERLIKQGNYCYDNRIDQIILDINLYMLSENRYVISLKQLVF